MSSVYKTPRVRLFGSDGSKVLESVRAEMDWTASRRSRPLNQLLPATRRWAESLPDTHRPDNLLRAFPRIANQLAHVWHDASAVAALLDDLLIDRRGGRKGFPTSVLGELLSLRATIDGGHSCHLRR